MSWQEIVFDVLPLVVSVVCSLILFFRTGKKGYLTRLERVLQEYFVRNDRSVSSETVKAVEEANPDLGVSLEEYGLTVEELCCAFDAWLESLKNGNDK